MVLVVVGVLCAAYATLSWYGFDLLEEGYFLTHARRVQLGALPYRDFSTPYTPGVFYLYAWLMQGLHAGVVALRLLQVAARAATYVVLYAAGRRLMPPAFAVAAPAVLVAMDTAPELWGIHPGWIATAAVSLAVLSVAHYLSDGRPRYLAAAGVAAGVAFAFKQNLAAYALMAALWLLVVAERRLPPLPAPRPHGALAPLGRLMRFFGRASGGATARAGRSAVQVAALALLPLTGAVVVRPYLSLETAALYVAPLAALSAVGYLRLMSGALCAPSSGTRDGRLLGRETAFWARPLLVLAGFGAVTLPWLVALVRALGGRLDLLGAFVGEIDPTGYYFGLRPPTAAHVWLVGLALLPLLLFTGAPGGRGAVRGNGGRASRLAGGWWGGRSILPPRLLPLGLLPVGLWYAVSGVGGTPRRTDDLILYLPALAFWAGLASFATRDASGPRSTVRLWYLAAGGALFLNQYPRTDEIHFLWSAGFLLVVGADVLARCAARTGWPAAPSRGRVGTVAGSSRLAGGPAAVWLSCLLLPAVACLPHLAQRLGAWSGLAAGGPARLAPLALPVGGRVWLPAPDAAAMQEVVVLLRQQTAPGEPIFTYPAIPGFYYLADRPSASPFLHLLTGLATPADQTEIVRRLAAVRYVVWDDGGAHFWVHPGDNAPVTEYVRQHFRVERFIGRYAVLARDAAGPALPYTLPTRGEGTTAG